MRAVKPASRLENLERAVKPALEASAFVVMEGGGKGSRGRHRGLGEAESRSVAGSRLPQSGVEASIRREAWGSKVGWNRTIRISRGKRWLQTPRRGQAAAVEAVATRRRRRLSQWRPVGGMLHPAKPSLSKRLITCVWGDAAEGPISLPGPWVEEKDEEERTNPFPLAGLASEPASPSRKPVQYPGPDGSGREG